MSKLRNVSEEILVGAKFVEVGKSAKLTRGQFKASKNVNTTLSSTKTEYYVSTSPNELVGGVWVDVKPNVGAGQYLWTRAKYIYTDGKTVTSNTTYQLKTSDVDTSFTITSYYLRSQYSTGITKETAGWDTTMPQLTPTYKYMWYYESYTYSSGAASTESDCFIVGVYGDTGISITSTEDVYAVNNSSTTAPSSGWDTFDNVKGQIDATHQYLWNKEIVHYSNGNSDDLDAHIIYRYAVDGRDGATITEIKYGVSSSASTEPSSWNTSVPSLSKGDWLWARTTYSNSDVQYTKSYIGTDGDDGNSIYVQSATKSGKTTTVVIVDDEGHSNTLTIDDGTDGTNGTNGTNGLNGYVHIAWANSADGSVDFSTSVSTGKQYIGTYTDNTQTDSQTYSDYSWAKIKGETGDTGVGLSDIEEQFAYGTASAATGTWGSSSLVPSSTTGQNYVWQRERVVYDTSPATYGSWTTPHMIAMWIKGDTGDAAKVFDIICAENSFKRNLRLSGYITAITFDLDIQGYPSGAVHTTTVTGSDSTVYINADTSATSYSLNTIPYTNSHDKITISSTLSVSGSVVATVSKVLTVIDETLEPMYLGELSAIPTPSAFGFESFINGDYFSCVQTNQIDGITAGIPYEYNGTSWDAMTLATKEQKVKAFTCLGGMLNSNVTIPSSATLYAWIGSLVAQEASIASLFAKLIEVGNAIYGGNVDLNASVGSRAYGKGFIMDSNGVMEISEGYARNMNVRGILNLYNEDGISSGAEIYHPAITTVRGMAGDSTGVTADSPTRWKQSDLTDLITTQNTELAESGTFGSDTVTKLLKLTNLSTYKSNNTITRSSITTTGTSNTSRVRYGNNVYVILRAYQVNMNWFYRLSYSSDGINFTDSYVYDSGSRVSRGYNLQFIDGFFYAYMGSLQNCFKSSDGINWISITNGTDCPYLSSFNTYGKGNGIYFSSSRLATDSYSVSISETLLGTYSDTGVSMQSNAVYSEVDKCFYTNINGDLCSSTDCTNWTPTGGTAPSSFLFVCEGILFTSYSNDSSQLLYSVDEGVTWNSISGGYYSYYTQFCFDGVKLIGYGTSSSNAYAFQYSTNNITKDFLGKCLYLTGTTWKEIDPSVITTTSVSLSGSISFSSSSHINYRTLSNFLNYTSYTYTEGGETHTATIDVGITYRITSTGFKINNVSRNAIFFTRNDASVATIVCSDGTVLSFSSGGYYYVEGTIAIAESFDGVEMMGQYPKDDMIYDIGTPTKRWLTGYISNLPLTSKLSEKTGVIPFERSAIPLLNSVSVVRYRLKKLPDTPLIGFIADYTDSDLSGEKHDSMMVNNCLGVLIKAIQELSAEVEELKSRLSTK